MKLWPKVQTQDTGWLPVPEGHASSNTSGFVLCFSNKTSCVLVTARPHTQHQQVLRSHELCVRLGDQYVFLDPLFFLSPACLMHSCYMLSAAPLSTVSHPVGIFSAAAQLCCYFPFSATKCNRHSYWAGHRSSRPCVSGRFPKQRCISSNRKITNG